MFGGRIMEKVGLITPTDLGNRVSPYYKSRTMCT